MSSPSSARSRRARNLPASKCTTNSEKSLRKGQGKLRSGVREFPGDNVKFGKFSVKNPGFVARNAENDPKSELLQPGGALDHRAGLSRRAKTPEGSRKFRGRLPREFDRSSFPIGLVA